MRLEGPIDLPAVLQGGQAFRWTRAGDAFHGVVGAHALRIEPRAGGAVEARAAPRMGRASIERYLGLGAQADARRDRVGRDPRLADAVRANPGLRILRQDPWETTVAFITSANNNVLRIEGILQRLALAHGAPLASTEPAVPDLPAPHAFPDAAALARVPETALRAAGLGYRAPFLRESARTVARGDVDLDALRGASWADARDALLALPGVGPKVADCIALFSLDVTGAFPVDRWVLRAVVDTFPESFPAGRDARPREVEAFARERWGEDAGLAQQYLFHLARVKQGAPGTARMERP